MKPIWLSALLCAIFSSEHGASNAEECRKTCRVKSGGSNSTDDAPAILQAFENCGRHGRIIFEPTTYYVNSVMNVSWLEDVDIDIRGTLLVNHSTSIIALLKTETDVSCL
jgi:hypothetical protein